MWGGADAENYGHACGGNCRSRVRQRRPRALTAEPYIADMQVISSDANARFLKLGLKKAVVMDLPIDFKDSTFGGCL